MNILDIIKGLIFNLNLFAVSQNTYADSADLRKAECPACHFNLKKIPGAKTKCPHCSEYIFVRTDPHKNARVVVTKSEADLIDEEWAKLNGTFDNFKAQKDEYEQIKADLIKRGKTPRENDIRWGLCNKHLGIHYKNRDWGLYRCVRFDMAVILRRERRANESLKTFLEVAYLDLNGVNNIGGLSGKYAQQFSPELGCIPDAVLGYILDTIKNEKISMADVKDLFMKQGLLIQRSMSPPLSLEKCWKILEKRMNTS